MSRTLSRLKRERGISLETTWRKCTSSRIERRIYWVFLQLSQQILVPLELRLVPQVPTHWGLRNVQSSCELLGPSRNSSSVAAVAEVPIRVKAGTSVILSRADMDLSVPRGFRRGVSPLSWGDMQVRSSLEMEKQHQISCWVEIGIGGFLSRCHRAVTPAIVF